MVQIIFFPVYILPDYSGVLLYVYFFSIKIILILILSNPNYNETFAVEFNLKILNTKKNTAAIILKTNYE